MTAEIDDGSSPTPLMPLRLTLMIALALLVSAFLAGLLPGAAGFSITIFVLPAFAILIAVFIPCSLALTVRDAWRGRHQRRRLGVALAGPAALALAVALTVPALRLGRNAFVWSILLVGRSSLDTIVRQATVAPPSREPTTWVDGTLPYIIDHGRPTRVAFVTNPGLLDNWSGIVFDPTGDVMIADG